MVPWPGRAKRKANRVLSSSRPRATYRDVESKSHNFVADLSLRLLLWFQDEMLNPSSDYANSRPYKIFVSMLQKWEIGYDLTGKHIFVALRSIKKAVEENLDTGEEVQR